MQLFCSRNRMVKLVSVIEDFVFAMSLFGKEYETSDSVKETLEKLVCLLYHVKLKIDLNKARCKLFIRKEGYGICLGYGISSI